VKLRHSAIDDPVATWRAARARTRRLFDIITPDAYYDRPIALRNPVVFYEGHLPAFAVNTLVKRTFGGRGIDEHLETLFARGIDPADEASAKTPTDVWPSRDEVQAYGREAERLVEETLRSTPVVEATFTILEHELMHQETLLYMLHELPYGKKRRPVAQSSSRQGAHPVDRSTRRLGDSVTIPASRAHLGHSRECFGWDNEFEAHEVDVPEFTIDAHNVTNDSYLEYMEATGASAPHFWAREDGQWFWRGMFEPIALPLDGPVYVTHDEATAYARWKGGRLPSEAELDRATYGTTPPAEGNFDFQHWDPLPVGSYAPNAWGMYDLIGNGWEWTSTVFAPFDGFRPMPSYPEYSADFFDGAHYVMKGASPSTPRELVRRSFRNWFRPSYPFVYATFRCAR